jgi:glycosyltransferase involved in cell wall biosynthesis
MKEGMTGIFNHHKWPWKENENPSRIYKDLKTLPKVTVIIPSYNQGAFIEETILSVVNQHYPKLELIIIDGGSNDSTLEIIKKYASHITWWVSEKDKGQSHAINKGLEKATGDWIAWLNSDDCYLPDALYYLFNEMDLSFYNFIYGNCLTGEGLANSKEVKCMESDEIALCKIVRFFFSSDYIIPSQSVFIKRELVLKAGNLNEDLHYCMDLDWYARIFMLKPKVYKYPKTLSFFRYNSETKTGSLSMVNSEDNKMGHEAERLGLKYAHYLSFWEKIKFKNLFNYYLMYSKEPGRHENPSVRYLFVLFLRHPFKSLADRRVLGLVKRKVFYSTGEKRKHER